MVRKWKTCASLGWKALSASLALTACAQILGLEEPTGIRAVDASATDAPSEIDANVPVPTPAGCKDRKIDAPESVIFVAADKGKDAADCGGPGNPCQTINKGLAQAQAASRDRVIVGSGTYAEAVVVPAAITLEGRWKSIVGGQWQPACGGTRADLSILKPPADAPRGISVTPATAGSAVTLRYLRIETPDASTKPADRSAYGIYAKDAVLAVDTVDIVVGKGAKADPPASANGTDGSTVLHTGGDLQKPCVSGTNAAAGVDGKAGTDGTVTATTLFGTFTDSGFTPGDGANGKDGTDGENGGATTAPAPTASCKSCGLLAACVDDGAKTASRGVAGCGGTLGRGGKGGPGGGGSFGIYAWRSTLTVTATSVATQDGADGLKGGTGGKAGAAESVPAKGADVTCNTNCVSSGLAACASTNSPQTSAATAPTKGGAGGKGANGADGGGGPSLGIFLGDSAKATFTDDSKASISFGKAGTNANAAIAAPPAAAVFPEAP